MTSPLMKIVSPFFFFFSYFISIDEDVKNSAVSHDPCYSDYESDDESDYASFISRDIQ